MWSLVTRTGIWLCSHWAAVILSICLRFHGSNGEWSGRDVDLNFLDVLLRTVVSCDASTYLGVNQLVVNHQQSV